jgi:hypothetical protein
MTLQFVSQVIPSNLVEEQATVVAEQPATQIHFNFGIQPPQQQQ